MNEDELKAVVEELKAEKEAMSNKSKELLAELKKERQKNKEVDMDAYHATLDELESAKSEISKLYNESKLTKKEFDKLQASLGEKDGALQGLLIDQGLTSELTKAGVKPELMQYVKDSLRSKAKLQGENGQYTAVIGDKILSEFITEWANGDGKAVIAAPQSSGGGGQGGGGTNPPKQDISGLSPIEMMKQGRKG